MTCEIQTYRRFPMWWIIGGLALFVVGVFVVVTVNAERPEE